MASCSNGSKSMQGFSNVADREKWRELDQELEVLAWDAADRPLVVRHEAWLLVLDGRVVGGASLGRESVPRSKNPGAHDAALRLLGWLFTPPSH